MLRHKIVVLVGVLTAVLCGCGDVQGLAGDHDGVDEIDLSYLEQGLSSELVDCGEHSYIGPDGDTVTAPERYNFVLMTAEIAANPHIGERAGFDAVTDCAQARRYTAARTAFLDELSAPVDDGEDDSEVEASVGALMGGTEVLGKRGLVQIGNFCTGFILNRRVVVTAAHCLFGSAASGNSSFTIYHFHPTRGKEVIGSGTMRYTRNPNWLGNVNPEFDIGFIKYDRDWTGTTTADYLPIYQDFASRIGRVRAWGAGHYTMSGTGSGVLRNRHFDVNSYNYQRFYTTAGEQRRHCGGDSGGPAIREVNGRNLVTGIITVVQVANRGDNCAKKGGRQYYTRTQWDNLRWIAQESRSNCTLAAADGFEFRTCQSVQNAVW